jgi:hypothetical protein
MTISPGSLASVAVVITTYNHAHFLREAINSVLEQSVPAREIIVVDDGSTDHPDRIAASFPSVRVIRQANSGLAAARNTGWQAAASDFVMFLDADDRLLPEAIAANHARLNAHPEAAFSYGAYVNVDVSSNVTTSAEFRPANDGFASFLRENPIGMHATVMYRRALVAAAGGFDTDMRACEDYDMYLRMARQYPTVNGDEPLAEYRHHGANMSLDSRLMLEGSLDALHRQKNAARSASALEAYHEGVAGWKRTYVGQWWTEVARAVGSRALNVELLRQGMFLVFRAPLTVVRVALDRLCLRVMTRARRRSFVEADTAL